MELRSQVLRGEILHPGREFEAVATRVEVRWDPLTGHAARLVTATSGGLWPPADPQALTGLAEETQASCPFCAERIERATPKLPPAIWPQGRVRRGRAALCGRGGRRPRRAGRAAGRRAGVGHRDRAGPVRGAGV